MGDAQPRHRQDRRHLVRARRDQRRICRSSRSTTVNRARCRRDGRGATMSPTSILTDPLGPLWYRGLVTAAIPTRRPSAPRPSRPPPPLTSEQELDAVLAAYGAQRLVIAPHAEPARASVSPGGRLARIDTGISRYYGGPLSWLEIVGDRMVAAHGAADAVTKEGANERHCTHCRIALAELACVAKPRRASRRRCSPATRRSGSRSRADLRRSPRTAAETPRPATHDGRRRQLIRSRSRRAGSRARRATSATSAAARRAYRDGAAAARCSSIRRG